MHLGVNLSNALQQLESVKAAVDQSADPKLKVTWATHETIFSIIKLTTTHLGTNNWKQFLDL